jgi:hypothetical protein
MRSTTMAQVNYTKVLDLTKQLDVKRVQLLENVQESNLRRKGKTKPSTESLCPYFGSLGTLDVSVQVDMASESESESDNAGVDLPSSDFSMCSANRRWAGLEDGDVIMMSELPSALERDRTSAVLSRKATTTIIIDGYIPCRRESIPASELRKHELKETYRKLGHG